MRGGLLFAIFCRGTFINELMYYCSRAYYVLRKCKKEKENVYTISDITGEMCTRSVTYTHPIRKLYPKGSTYYMKIISQVLIHSDIY